MTMIFSKKDKQWMQRVLEFAEKGRGKVSPNPMVGCVIVKNNRILAEGYHQKFGGPHAEIMALGKVKSPSLLHGATLYVNLEPCVHFGKTPPCMPVVRNSGIKRIVVGMKDPNPLVSGRGIRALREAGIQVIVGCLENTCAKLNEVFIRNMKTGLPFVAVKVAMSLDGKNATKTGESKWITSQTSRKLVKKLRAGYDAILVGKNTVLQDNPVLSAQGREPIRIILDSSLETPISAKVYRNENVIVATTNKASRRKRETFLKKGVTLRIFPRKIQLRSFLHWLSVEKNIKSVFVEGGSKTFGSFFDEKLVDKVYFFIAPKIIGGEKAKSAVAGEGIRFLRQAIMVSSWEIRSVGQDFLITGQIA